MSKIFDKIENYAKKRGLSITDVAERSNLTNATLYNWKKNDENVKAKNVYNVAKALNVKPTYLLGWEDEENSNAFELYGASEDNFTINGKKLTMEQIKMLQRQAVSMLDNSDIVVIDKNELNNIIDELNSIKTKLYNLK